MDGLVTPLPFPKTKILLPDKTLLLITVDDNVDNDDDDDDDDNDVGKDVDVIIKSLGRPPRISDAQIITLFLLSVTLIIAFLFDKTKGDEILKATSAFEIERGRPPRAASP